MEKFLKKLANHKELVLLAVVGLLYILTAPLTVQSGDTGELVANSYHLRVAHPPGYPLYTLLYHFPVKYLTFRTPFFVAGLVTSMLTLCYMGIWLYSFKLVEVLLALGVLATSMLIWKLSILPDVFSLHMFFCAWIIFVFMRPDILKSPLSILLCALSVTNHHTIVFLFPFYIHALLNQENKIRAILLSLLMGLVAASFYGLLFFFHPGDYGSWGDLRHFDDLVNHFLRTDYGTLQLSKSSSDPVNWFVFFLERFISDLWSVLIALVFIFYRYRENIVAIHSKLIVFGLSLGLYFLIFQTLAKVSVGQEGESIFERFLLQPIFLMVMLLLMLVIEFKVKFPKLLCAFFAINIGLNILTNFPHLNFRHNVSLADYVTNMFRQVPQDQALYVHGDTLGFAAYYLHTVENYRPDIKLIHTTWGWEWSRKKLKQSFPDLVYLKNSSLYQDLDFEKYRLFTNYFPQKVPEGFGVTALGPVYEIRKIKAGDPLLTYNCPAAYSLRSRPDLEEFDVFEIANYYDQSYGHCHFQMAIELLLKNQLEDALVQIRHATQLSPINAKYLERECFLLKVLGKQGLRDCEEKLDELLLKTSPQYYLEQYKTPEY